MLTTIVRSTILHAYIRYYDLDFAGDFRNMIDKRMPKNDSLFPSFVFDVDGDRTHYIKSFITKWRKV